MNPFDKVCKFLRRIGPVHLFQNAVITTLEGNMKMSTQPVFRGHHVYKFLVNLIRFNRTQPDPEWKILFPYKAE